MPKAIGDVGFPLAAHPTDPGTIWVFPMDGTSLWSRTSPDGKPAVYRTRNGGRSWQRLARGLPRANAWFTVYRQALAADGDPRATGLYFGTTGGSVWGSRDGGESWASLAEHPPRILSLRAVTEVSPLSPTAKLSPAPKRASALRKPPARTRRR